MFEKTRLRLVLLNAIVFFLLLNGFGITLYFYMKHHLYSQVDETLLRVKQRLMNEPKGHYEKLMNPEIEGTRQIEYLFWGEDKKIVLTMPEDTLVPKNLYGLLEKKQGERLFTINKNKNSFRIVNIPVHYKAAVKGKSKEIEKIQLVSSLQEENHLLAHLLTVIIAGSIMSAIAAVLAGFYLANRALVPIKNSWNKQSQFVADASHELRTPLSVMKLNLERLFRHPNHSIMDESENISDTIQEINYMTKMITNLLTLARSDSNQLEMFKEKVRLDEVLMRVVEGFKELAKLKDIRMEAAIASPIEMNGDPERLRQLFMIILDNALKYTKENGEINVRAFVKGAFIRLEISDTGAGIPKEELPFIFDRFYRGNKARTRDFEGSGLGLAIARWIIHSHDGKVKVKSEIGKGTLFIISFPDKKEM